MAIMILGTHCLYDIAKNDGNPAHRWYQLQERQGVLFGEICIGAFSIAQLKFSFAKTPPSTPEERALLANLSFLIDEFRTADAVIGCSPEAAEYWADNLDEVPIYNLPPPDYEVGTEALVIATVGAGHLGLQCTLADRLQPLHQRLGISVVDPYTGKTSP